MSKEQKKLFKSLKKDWMKKAFIKMLLAQQSVLGGFDHWTIIYNRKCEKRDVDRTSTY